VSQNGNKNNKLKVVYEIMMIEVIIGLIGTILISIIIGVLLSQSHNHYLDCDRKITNLLNQMEDLTEDIQKEVESDDVDYFERRRDFKDIVSDLRSLKGEVPDRYFKNLIERLESSCEELIEGHPTKDIERKRIPSKETNITPLANAPESIRKKTQKEYDKEFKKKKANKRREFLKEEIAKIKTTIQDVRYDLGYTNYLKNKLSKNR